MPGTIIKKLELRETWIRSFAKELSCLTQGVGDIKSTNTTFFIPGYEIPRDRLKEVTYVRIVVHM